MLRYLTRALCGALLAFAILLGLAIWAWRCEPWEEPEAKAERGICVAVSFI